MEEFNEVMKSYKGVSLCYGGRMKKVFQNGRETIVPNEHAIMFSTICSVGTHLSRKDDNTLTIGGEFLSAHADDCQMFQMRDKENEFMCLDWTNGCYVLMKAA